MFRRSRGTVPSLRTGISISYRLAFRAFDAIEGGVGAGDAPVLFHVNPAGLVVVPLVLFLVCNLLVWAHWFCFGSRHRNPSSMPKDVSDDADPALPFPGQFGPTGFATQHIRLKQLKKTELSDHCKTFGLAYSGNMATLTARLEAFSSDRSCWDSLIPGSTNTHKGPRKSNEDRKTKLKTSAIRRENLFQGADGVRVANAPVTERSKDLRTAKDKEAIMPWARYIVTTYPYRPNAGRSGTGASMYNNSPMHATASSAPGINTATLATVPGPESTAVVDNGNLAMQPQSVLLGTRSEAAAVPETAVVIPSISCPVPPPSTAPSDGFVPAAVDSLMVSASPDADGNNTASTRTLLLAGGKSVTFRECDIPDPPAVSYAKNFEDLLGVWNDKFPQWTGTSPLMIKNVPIPLVNYPSVYKYWKGTQWHGVKKVWFQWKILVQAMSRTTLDDFRAQYSVPDKDGNLQRPKYTPLLRTLKLEREAEDEKLAALALVELTPDQLTYWKGSERIVYNASNNELVQTNTLVKSAIIQIDATPFRQWYKTAFDVAPDGSQFATGFLDGSVHIYGERDQNPTGGDSVWEGPGSARACGARLSGLQGFRPGHAKHYSHPHGTHARGRNILLSSLDGTVRLWDVSSGEKIHTLAPARFSPVTSMSLGERAASTVPDATPADPDPQEVETGGKLLFCALQTRSFEVFDLEARALVYKSTSGAAPLTAIAYALDHSLLATGSSKGLVEVFDMRALGTPLSSFTRGEAGVADLRFGDGKTFE
ncbi:WD40-repeat-containing domain protein [Mycena olivaceomarginata]|nr:WD40-repeat-containing domain protein [Mycena olivaceomarginata]